MSQTKAARAKTISSPRLKEKNSNKQKHKWSFLTEVSEMKCIARFKLPFRGANLVRLLLFSLLIKCLLNSKELATHFAHAAKLTENETNHSNRPAQTAADLTTGSSSQFGSHHMKFGKRIGAPLEVEERAESGGHFDSRGPLFSPLGLHYSPNNRGPAASRLSSVSMGPLARHLSAFRLYGRRNADEPQASLMERRSDEEDVGHAYQERVPAGAHAESRASMAAGSGPHARTADGGGAREGSPRTLKWSQPDPRRAYSLPVSLIRLPSRRGQSAGASRRDTGHQQAANSSSVHVYRATPGLARSSAPPPDESDWAQQQWATTGALGAAAASGQADEPPASESAASEAPRQLASVVVASAGSAPQWPRQTAFGKRGQQMVALVRYVPVVMSVPADQLASLASSSSPSNVLTSGHHQPRARLAALRLPAGLASGAGGLPVEAALVEQQQASLGQQQPGGLARASAFQLLVAAPGGQPVGQAQQQAAWPEAEGAFQQQQQLGAAADSLGGDFSQLYASSALLAEPALLAHQQRLAYLQPVGPATQLVPATQAASRALSAYAARLMAMLRPSALLSSIGGGATPTGGSSGHAHATPIAATSQQLQTAGGQSAGARAAPNAPQIFLLAPADSVGVPAGIREQVGVPAGRQQARPEDLLVNQASKVHATKSSVQQTLVQPNLVQPPSLVQPSSSGQSAGNLQPLGGMICAQALIARPPQQQQSAAPMQQQQQADDSFEFERPPGEQTLVAPQQPQVQLQLQLVKGGRQQTSVEPAAKTRESPARLVQKLAGAKGARQQPFVQQQQQSLDEQDEFSLAEPQAFPAGQQLSQQQQSAQQQQLANQQQLGQQQLKLMGLSSESRGQTTSAEPGQRESSGELASGPRGATGRLRPPADEQDEQQTRFDREGRPVIPFTIRDKIELGPTWTQSRSGRLQAASHKLAGAARGLPATPTNSSPVQYDDEAAAEQWPSGGRSQPPRLSIAPLESQPPEAEPERRSRTSFVSSAAPTTTFGREPRREGGGAARIEYRPESAHSAARGPAAADDGQAGGRGAAGQSIPILMASSSSSSSSGSSSSTTGTAQQQRWSEWSAPAQVRHRSSSAAELRHSTRERGPHTPSRASSLLLRPTSAPGSSGFGDAAASSERRTVSTPTEGQLRGELRGELQARSSPAASQTVELLVNSSPVTPSYSAGSTDELDPKLSGATITASPLATTSAAATVQFQSTQVDSRADHPQQAGDTVSTSAGQLERAHEQSGALQASAQEPVESGAFHSSHDRSLSSGVAGDDLDGEKFGKISQSLQTNPLDLIDLQNSRSSFELPSQLESLSMLLPNGRDQHASAQQQVTSAQPEEQPQQSHQSARAKLTKKLGKIGKEMAARKSSNKGYSTAEYE